VNLLTVGQISASGTLQMHRQPITQMILPAASHRRRHEATSASNGAKEFIIWASSRALGRKLATFEMAGIKIHIQLINRHYDSMIETHFQREPRKPTLNWMSFSSFGTEPSL
jgi:hypothetical protein